jgi:hypothetical protein
MIYSKSLSNDDDYDNDDDDDNNNNINNNFTVYLPIQSHFYGAKRRPTFYENV